MPHVDSGETFLSGLFGFFGIFEKFGSRYVLRNQNFSIMPNGKVSSLVDHWEGWSLGHGLVSLFVCHMGTL